MALHGDVPGDAGSGAGVRGARRARRVFIPVVYHFFALNILAFWVALRYGDPALVARVFFVWISVFNLFAVSVFWSFMADVFSSAQGKRLFGLIAAGGSAGALLGPLVTVAIVGAIGPANLLFVAAVLLEAAVFCAQQLEFGERKTGGEARVGGSWFAGLAMVFRSPYLAGIALWVFGLSVAGTFLYLQQAEIVSHASADPAVRTRIFATIDLTVGVLTILVQFLATGKLIERYGVGRAAALLPLVFAVGFAVLAAWPVLAVVVAFQALQRTANFALSNPALQLLYTVLPREEKYKAKNAIDLLVFRGSDALSAAFFSALRGIGLEAAAISMLAVPIAGACVALALALGRGQERRAASAVNGS
jgi:AAA family ATP:ADP antiporter